MKERPIIFNGEMVRAIRDGIKTQTRRPIKEIPSWNHNGKDIMSWPLSGFYQKNCKFWLDIQTAVDDNSHIEVKCPYGQPGDRLWVRETWAEISDEFPLTHTEYKADTESKFPGGWPDDEGNDPECPKWCPSIHMPRWARRITLEIVNVRVERVQDISDSDARAEGWRPEYGCAPYCWYRSVWDSIYGKKYPWESNPFVWVIEFTVIKS